MDNERQFRLLSLILLGLCGLVFIRQISSAPTSSIGFGRKIAAANASSTAGKSSGLIDDIMRPLSTELEVNSVAEVEGINAGKTPSFNAGLPMSPAPESSLSEETLLAK